MIKKLVNKYSFLGSYGVLVVFLICGIIPIFIHDINIVMPSVGFISVFWVKYMVKNKFDILRFDMGSKMLLILDMLTLGLIFLIEPLVIFLFKLHENMEIREIILDIFVTAVGFALLFILYNGYTSVLISRIRKVLIFCMVFVVIILSCASVYYTDYVMLFICSGVAFSLFYIGAFFGISRKKYIEVTEGTNVYRYCLKDGTIFAIYKELFKGIFVPVLKYKNYKRMCDFEISEKWENLAENLKDIENNENKQLVINCFYENPVFCLEMASRNTNKYIFKTKFRNYLLLIAICVLLIYYRISKNDMASSVIALALFFTSVYKFYYCLYLEKKWLHCKIFMKLVAFSLFVLVFLLNNKIYFEIQIVVSLGTLTVFLFRWIKSNDLKKIMNKNDNYVYFCTENKE